MGTWEKKETKIHIYILIYAHPGDGQNEKKKGVKKRLKITIVCSKIKEMLFLTNFIHVYINLLKYIGEERQV